MMCSCSTVDTPKSVERLHNNCPTQFLRKCNEGGPRVRSETYVMAIPLFETVNTQSVRFSGDTFGKAKRSCLDFLVILEPPSGHYAGDFRPPVREPEEVNYVCYNGALNGTLLTI